MTLAVLQFGRWVGELESTPDRGIVFRYKPEYAAAESALPLSQSLPVREGEYSQAAALPFFAGLLPDGDLRRRIADALHFSETSSLKLLEALGGECAGTISLQRMDDDSSSFAAYDDGGYEELEPQDLERMVLESERIPLLLPRGGTRLSLAGAQDKIPLLRRDGRWFKPTGSAPTSHILKPASHAFPEIVYNEYAAMQLAGFLSLPVPKLAVAELGRPVLVVERYDRRVDAGGRLLRLHQEDFCQALGIAPDRKYQSDGGPGFSAMAALVRRACGAPLLDLERLIDAALFNVLIGNCDAHGKNFSLLYRDGTVALAPFYDLIATTFWPELETKLSMKFGAAYSLEKLQAEDLALFARDLAVAPKGVRRRLDRFREEAPAAWERLRGLPALEAQGPLLESLQSGWWSRMDGLTA